MMYNDVDSDLTPFNDQIDGDEIFLFSNTKTSSTGASFLHDDEDDQLRHHNNVVASTSSHHMPVDVDDLLLNTNFLEQPNGDTTEDPLFWNCKDISDDHLNDIWPQSQVNLSVSNISTINGLTNSNCNIQSNNSLGLAQTLSIGPTTSLSNCNNSSNTQQQQHQIHNGIIINHQQPQITPQVHQHSQQTIINIQQQQQLLQQQHSLASLNQLQTSQISQLQQQQQHLQVRLQQSQQNDQRAHHQQAIRTILPSNQATLLHQQQQQGFQQPQQIIQHLDNFQNNWITVVSSNDQFQTFNTLPPQQIDNQQQVSQFFDKITHTIIQTDNGQIAAQIPVTGVITATGQQVLLQQPQIAHLQQQQQEQQPQQQQQLQQQQQPQPQPQQQQHQQQQQQQSQSQPVATAQIIQQNQDLQKQQSQGMQPQQQSKGLQSQQQSRKLPTQQPRSNQLKLKKEPNKSNQEQIIEKPKSEPEISDTSNKEVASKLNKPKEKQTRLDCPYCKRSFSKNFDLQQHMRCHTGEKPFQCIVCGRGFAQKSNVKKHMQAHKVWPEGPNPAMPSNNSIRGRDNLASSSLGIQRDDECMQENESVNINNELSSGLSNDRKNDGTDIFAENRYSCSYCHFNGKTYFELKSHLTIHKREKVFKCIVSSCGKTFSGSDLQGFLDHVTGHKDLIYHCHLCSGQFHSLDEFGEHQKHHSNAQLRKSSQNQSLSSNSHPQQIQNLSKPTTASLRQQNQQVVPPTQLQPQQNQRQHNQQHTIVTLQPTQPALQQQTQPQPQLQLQLQPQLQQQHHQPQITIQKTTKVRIKNNQKFFRCSKCMNRYTTQTALDHHLSISTHNFPCTECNKVFMCERYLRRHLNTHTAVQHVCTFCDKQFKTAAYLKMHSVVHTGEKPFRCNQCDAAFNRRDKLSRHKLTHETVKKFKCPFRPNIGCTKEFNRPDKLKAHVLTHSGVRPHPCDLCSRTFSRLSRLREHKKLHHGGMPMPCDTDPKQEVM